MKKITSVIALAAFLVAGVVGIASVNAQTMATMPVLYSQSGQAVNTSSNTYLPAGWYFLQSNGSTASQVYYYGNGTYYNANVGQYGGSVGDPNGTAGVTLNYASPNTPGLPNTGAGGQSIVMWMILIVSGLVVAAGASYLVSAKLRQNLVLKQK